MSKKINYSILGLMLILSAGCKNPAEKLKSERIEAAKEISDAEANVKKTELNSAIKVQNAPDSKKAEKKIEATENIADANRKVDNEKIEATKEITDAEQKAGAGGSYTK